MSPLDAAVLEPAQHLEYVAADVARMAAEFVLHSVGRAAAARTKSSPTDVVTLTDVESERLIRSELLVRCPGSTIVGEELDDEIGDSGMGWIVDPIDGTVNFLYDLPVVSVSIAATIDDRVVAGAVVDILRGDLFTAALGSGASRNGEPIVASQPASLDQALVGTGFSYDATLRKAQADVLTRVLPACRDIRCMGSAALNLCWVGCGRLDAYFERDIKVYDYAAGALIAAEAGAEVELGPNNDLDLTLVSSPAIYDELISLVNRG